MDNIDKVTSFFAENGVILTPSQIDKIELYFNETRAHGYAVDQATKSRGEKTSVGLNGLPTVNMKTLDGENLDKVERFTREIDVYNNKLKRKEITQEEFNKKINEIKEKAGSLAKYLSDDGSKSMNKFENGRPTKNGKPSEETIKDYYSDTDIRDTDNGKSEYKTIVYPSDEFKEKIERHNYLANASDNPKETLKEKKIISKLVGGDSLNKSDNEKDIRVDIDNKNNLVHIITQTPKEPGHNNENLKNSKLTHMSDKQNIESLKPSARSKEGILYGDERIYLSKDHDPSLKKGFRGINKYSVDPDEIKDLPITKDPDSNKDDIYVSTEKKIKTKKND